MDWNRVQGNWKQVEGKVKAKWGKLTDDDLAFDLLPLSLNTVPVHDHLHHHFG